MTTAENAALAVEFIDVSKIYHTYSTPQHRLLEILSGGRKRYARETRALDGVSFALARGARLGIVGENGSGKSTLLKVLAGVLTPTAGTVEVNGRVSALLELGAGFNPELPGEENIRQYCMLHGMHHAEIEEAVPAIIGFSELRDAIDQPVKTYSSGMAVRLGFACAVHARPEILIVDEALSVGDAYFQNKCLHKIKSLLDQGATFVYVTHTADSIRALCDEGLWLERGRVRLRGPSHSVGSAYQSEVFSRLVRAGLPSGQAAPPEAQTAKPASSTVPKVDDRRLRAFAERVASLRTGSGEVRIDDISVVGEDGSDTDSVGVDERLRIRVIYHVRSRPSDKAILNIGVTDRAGTQILHFNPMFSGIFASDAPPEIPQMLEVSFRNPLCPGEYGVVAGIASLFDNPRNYGQTLIDRVIDYCPGGARFSVRFPDRVVEKDFWGIVHVEHEFTSTSLD